MKAMLREIFIPPNAFIRNWKDPSILTAHLKALEQKESNTPKRSRQQEIIKLKAEIEQFETKRTRQRVKK